MASRPLHRDRTPCLTARTRAQGSARDPGDLARMTIIRPSDIYQCNTPHAYPSTQTSAPPPAPSLHTSRISASTVIDLLLDAAIFSKTVSPPSPRVCRLHHRRLSIQTHGPGRRAREATPKGNHGHDRRTRVEGTPLSGHQLEPTSSRR